MKSKFLLGLSLTVLSVAAPIPVANPSFEAATLPINGGNGPFSQLIAGSPFGVGGTLDSWTASSTTTNAQVGAFDPNPGGVNWTTQWWDGNNVGYLIVLGGQATLSLSQTLSDTLLSNTEYTLTVDIGRRAVQSEFNYAIQLFAGGTLLASASNLALANDSSGTDSATYWSIPGNPLAGEELRIVLTSTSPAGAYTEAFFDNVRLDATQPTTSPVPEPGTLLMVSAGLIAALTMRRGRY